LATLSFSMKRSSLEALVLGRLRALLADPVEFMNAISNGERDAPMQKSSRDAAAALSARWEHLPTETQHDFARSILLRAQVHADRIDLDIGSARLVRARESEDRFRRNLCRCAATIGRQDSSTSTGELPICLDRIGRKG
jgi:hypothetical protein